MFSDSDSPEESKSPFDANFDLADFNKNFKHVTALNDWELLKQV